MLPSANRGPSQHGPFSLGAFAIDDYNSIKVVVIGAGFSGIAAAIRQVQTVMPEFTTISLGYLCPWSHVLDFLRECLT